MSVDEERYSSRNRHGATVTLNPICPSGVQERSVRQGGGDRWTGGRSSRGTPRASPETETEALAKEFCERITEHDLSVIDDLCADEFAVEIARPGTDESVVEGDGLKSIFEEYFTPTFRFDVDAVVADNEQVALFWTTRGTHEGEFRGFSPTGNEIAVTEGGLVRAADGKNVDLRPQADIVGLVEQLGASLER